MKYIRTEKKIIDEKQGLELAIEWFGTFYYGNHKEDILDNYLSKKQFKTADTIEKLCDEFVYVNCKYDDLDMGYQYRNYKNLDDIRYGEVKIYGAIWTDKGLIYVAKMNKEGQFELLWPVKS